MMRTNSRNREAATVFVWNGGAAFEDFDAERDDRAHRYLRRARELKAAAAKIKDDAAKAMISDTAEEYLALARAVASQRT